MSKLQLQAERLRHYGGPGQVHLAPFHPPRYTATRQRNEWLPWAVGHVELPLEVADALLCIHRKKKYRSNDEGKLRPNGIR